MKECIMLGRGPTRLNCPHDKEVWTVSWAWEFTENFQKFFTVHTWDEESVDDIKRLQEKIGFDIIAPEPHPDLKVTVFPIEHMLTHFGCKLYSDLICYMMSYAILIEKVDRIWWYGIDCMGYTTYTMERGGMEFWAGVAKGRGIDVINTADSATLKPKNGMYGDWGDRQKEVALALGRTDGKREHNPFRGIKSGDWGGKWQ